MVYSQVPVCFVSPNTGPSGELSSWQGNRLWASEAPLSCPVNRIQEPGTESLLHTSGVGVTLMAGR